MHRARLVAVKDVTIARVATGMIGVLNNRQWIYETGRRTLTLDDESTVIPAHSGKTLAGEANHIVIHTAQMTTRGLSGGMANDQIKVADSS